MKLDNRLMAIALIVMGVVGRIWLRWLMPSAPHFYISLNGASYPIFMMDMFFWVAAISMIAGRYLGKLYSFIVPFSIMAISDIYFGNTWIFIFTWTGFMMMGIVAYKRKNATYSSYIGYGLASVILYDIWTNFGSWLGWYPHNLDGLILCYTLAIPFMLWHILSSAIAIPLLSIPFEYARTLHDEVSEPNGA